MKLKFIYIITTLIISITAIDEDISLNSVNKKALSSQISVQRRKSNLFPKSLKKFTVTTPAVITKPVNLKQKTTSRVLMRKISPLFGTTESPFRYTRPMSRKPFLKVKKFTIDLSTKSWKNEIVQEEHSNSENSKEISKKSKELEVSSELSDEMSNEDDHVTVIDEIDDDNGLRHSTKSTFLTNKSRNSINKIQLFETKRMKRNEEVSTTTFDDYSSEEAKDLNEYIFLPKFVQSIQIEDLFSNKNEKNSRSNYKTPKSISKRSIKNNIIEEEEFGSTISGFKFTALPLETGVESYAFRNINS